MTVISSRDQTPEVRVPAQIDPSRNRTSKGVSPFSQDETVAEDEVRTQAGETGGGGGGVSEVKELEIGIGGGDDVQDIGIVVEDIIPLTASRPNANALTAEKKLPSRGVKGAI